MNGHNQLDMEEHCKKFLEVCNAIGGSCIPATKTQLGIYIYIQELIKVVHKKFQWLPVQIVLINILFIYMHNQNFIISEY